MGYGEEREEGVMMRGEGVQREEWVWDEVCLL